MQKHELLSRSAAEGTVICFPLIELSRVGRRHLVDLVGHH
jgi:hypothetical protein